MKKKMSVITGKKDELVSLLLEEQTHLTDGKYLFLYESKLHGKFTVLSGDVHWNRQPPVKVLFEDKDILEDDLAHHLFESSKYTRVSLTIKVTKQKSDAVVTYVDNSSKECFLHENIDLPDTPIFFLEEIFSKNLIALIRDHQRIVFHGPFDFNFEGSLFEGKKICTTKYIERAPIKKIKALNNKRLCFLLNLIEVNNEMEEELGTIEKNLASTGSQLKYSIEKTLLTQAQLKEQLCKYAWVHYIGHGDLEHGFHLQDECLFLKDMKIEFPQVLILSSCQAITEACIEHFFSQGGRLLIFFRGELESKVGSELFRLFYWKLIYNEETVNQSMLSVRKKLIKLGCEASQIVLYGNGNLRLKHFYQLPR